MDTRRDFAAVLFGLGLVVLAGAVAFATTHDRKRTPVEQSRMAIEVWRQGPGQSLPPECDPLGTGVRPELHRVRLELYGKERQQFLENPPQFLKGQFEGNGMRVNGVRLSTSPRVKIDSPTLGLKCCHVKSGHYKCWEYCWV